MSGLQPCRERSVRPGAAAKAARSAHMLSVAFWLGVALTLGGIGYAIAIALESTLLGWLGADLVFLIAMSVYTSGPGRDRR